MWQAVFVKFVGTRAEYDKLNAETVELAEEYRTLEGEPMSRTMYCPICAAEVQQHSMNFGCASGRALSSRLGYSLQRAVQLVAPSAEPPREVALSPYLSCPNCTVELEEYDDRVRRLQCPACGLRMSTEDQLELMEDKPYHPDPKESSW